MIFSRDIDKILWLMVASDKKNSYDIAKLVGSIPMDLMDEVRDLLKNRLVSKDKSISRLMSDYLGNTYLFTIYINDGGMRIKASKFEVCNAILEVHELYLSNVLLNETLIIDSTSIGSYFKQIRKTLFPSILEKLLVVTNCDKVDYELLDMVGQNVFVQVSDAHIYEKKVSLKKMPEEIYVDNIISTSRINRLVRKKKEGRKN